MEKLKQQIENFKPTCEQEERDKEYFLKFIDTFDDVLTRENVFGHLSSSAWVLNKDRTKVLLVYHNIMDGYIFPGGHLDGETDCLSVALREVEEETGIKAKPISEEVFSIWTGPVKAHIKRGKYVSAHTHLDIDFLCVADENRPLKIKPDENQNVIWADINEIGKSIKLVDFFVPVFENFKEKINIKKFSFKIFFKDGSTKVLGGKANKPENLKYDFDGMVSWEDYYSFTDKERSDKEVVNLAYKLYNKAYNDQIVKVEIINIETDETVVYSD